jgi:hypothetical protein
MAKDKKNKVAKPKNAKQKDPTAKLAKEIGKQTDKFVELARHPFIADIVSAGLAALAANVSKGSARADDAKPAGKPGDIGESAKMLATALAAKAAERVSSRLFEATAPKAAEAPAAPKPAARKPAAKKAPAKKPAAKAATAAKPRTAAKPKPSPAKASPAKPAAAKAAATKATKPAAAKPKAPAARKPAARKPAAKPAS